MGYLTFILVVLCGPKGRKWELVERIGAKFSNELLFLFLFCFVFLTTMLLTELIFGPNGPPELDYFDNFLGLETENLPNLGILNRILEKFCDFLVTMGSCGSIKMLERGGAVEWLRVREKEVFSAGHPRNPFQGKYPRRPMPHSDS